jgi:hypothetical protein
VRRLAPRVTRFTAGQRGARRTMAIGDGAMM